MPADDTSCRICPRACDADRANGERGYCRAGAELEIASICLHTGEEPGISGPHGICNVFFSGCNMRCVYCQNVQISGATVPAPIMRIEDALARIESILDKGAQAVGFVSPSHCVPQMTRIIRALHDHGRRPVTVMNTNAYDSVETLRSVAGLIDVYLPDLKYADDTQARRLSDAPGYPRIARAALREMFRQKGSDLDMAHDGTIRSGLIVRHLVLPGLIGNTRRCLAFIAQQISPTIHVSLMAQYTPTPAVAGIPDLNRPLTRQEYSRAVDFLDEFGLHNGWVQEFTSIQHYMPDFRKPDPFGPNPPSSLPP